MPNHWPAADLRWVLHRALAHGSSLFTAGELRVVRTLQQIHPSVLAVYATLSLRKSMFQRCDDLDHLPALLDAGLICRFVPWSIRAHHSTVRELRAGARRLGIRPPPNPRRADWVALLSKHTHWSTTGWLRVCHRGLIARLERLAFLRPYPQRSELVVARLGHTRWPTFHPTGGASTFRSRRAMLTWETALHSADASELIDALRARTTVAPGHLDLSRSAARRVFEHAASIERSDPHLSIELYQDLAAAYRPYHTRALLRVAQLLERANQPQPALTLLTQLRETAIGAERLALSRQGRRLARKQGTGWAPDRPYAPIRTRSVRLPSAPHDGNRPRFSDGRKVEEAVVDMLSKTGRDAFHGEGGLWRHLYALIFSPTTYFLPIFGQLPSAHLGGPLSVGTPDFLIGRQREIEAVLSIVREGNAEKLVEQSHHRYFGSQLAGTRWPHSLQTDLSIVRGVGGPLLQFIMEQLLIFGWRHTRGMPDLLVLPGPPTKLSDAHPRTLPQTVFFAELKTKNDALSDHQRWWIEALQPHARTEVWHIEASPNG